MPTAFFQFSCSTKIVFNPGLSKDIGAELDALNLKKVLVVTDKMLADLGVIDPVLEGLKNAGVTVTSVFKEVLDNSELTTVKATAETAKAQGAEGLIAIGGGSVIDTAKAAAILMTHGGDLVSDYSGAETLPGPLKPVVAIPTTAGTG